MQQNLLGLLTLTSLFMFSACNSSGAPAGVTLEDGIQDTEHRIFVTSTLTLADFDGDPDAQCETLRTSAGLTRNYAAIVSTSTQDAKDKILDNGGAVYLFDDTGTSHIVASSIAALWDTQNTPLSHAINLDENGEALTGGNLVFTGSNSLGEKFADGGDYCADWASSANAYVRMGLATALNEDAISLLADGCHTARRLYCISQ